LKCGSPPIAQPDWTNGATCVNSASQAGSDISAKVPAQKGKDGKGGTHGNNATPAPILVGQQVSCQAGTDGLSDGLPGYGGAGALCSYPYNYSDLKGTCYGLGVGGSGGCPGTGGTGGKGGGSSIALLILNGSVESSGCLFRTGFAGSGGDGGASGKGGAGGKGSSPYVISGTAPAPPATCTPATDPLKLNCAGYGADGGSGGNGGHGGGGAGGWAIGIVMVGTAVHTSSDPSYDLGTPGVGGMGPLYRAPDGQKKPSFVLSN
jgi:hypothetical protein